MDLMENKNENEIELGGLKVDVSSAELISENDDSNGTNANIFTKDILYAIEDSPPWYISIFLALQHYLTFFGSAISLPFLLAPALCLDVNHPGRAYLTSTLLLVFGIVTLVQTTIGIRLPIVQGGSFAYLVPALAIMNLPHWQCPTNDNRVDRFVPSSNDTTAYDEVWTSRLRELQGDIALASILQVVIGLSGVTSLILRLITPLVITPTITLIGLSLFPQAAKLAAKNWPVSIGSIFFMILFSQYLRNIKIPLIFWSRKNGFWIIRYPMFSLLPVLLSIAIMWAICGTITALDLFESMNPARTDTSSQILTESPWIRLSYPLQWGVPTASLAGVIGMMAAVVASIIESIGDYYACARLCGAPPPPDHAINRGIAIEGLGGILAGLWGAGVGATSFSQNVGVISITKVASRKVVQYAACLMIFFGTFTKFGAVFVTIPEPIIGGVYCVMFAVITGVGISNAQFVDLNSSRNLFILGFSIFFGMALPSWISSNNEFIQTGSPAVDQVITVLLSTNMLVGGILGFVLDNTIPGSDEERGLVKWRNLISFADSKELAATYDLPWGMSYIKKWTWLKYLPFCPTYRRN